MKMLSLDRTLRMRKSRRCNRRARVAEATDLPDFDCTRSTHVDYHRPREVYGRNFCTRINVIAGSNRTHTFLDEAFRVVLGSHYCCFR